MPPESVRAVADGGEKKIVDIARQAPMNGRDALSVMVAVPVLPEATEIALA